jgi:hypothetical protein
MENPIVFVLLAIGLLQLKHFLCDFVFQTDWQAKYKGIYGHPAGLAHCGIHALGTIACLLLLQAAFSVVIGLTLAEYAIHYHTDWAKERITRRAGWTPATHIFWIALGADQLIHQLTYLAMAAVLALVRFS